VQVLDALLVCGDVGVWNIYCMIIGVMDMMLCIATASGLKGIMITSWDGRTNPNTQGRNNGNVGHGVVWGSEHLWQSEETIGGSLRQNNTGAEIGVDEINKICTCKARMQ